LSYLSPIVGGAAAIASGRAKQPGINAGNAGITPDIVELRDTTQYYRHSL
jgi:hypothetical protein